MISKDDRNWDGVRDFVNRKLTELQEMINLTPETNEGKLKQACAAKVKENVERQLGQIAFFSGHQKPAKKMKFTPLTNSASESRMAELDVKCNFTGGSTPITTISNKQVIGTNKLLLSTEFKDEDYIVEAFKWARTSEQAEVAKQHQQEFLEKVKITKELSLRAKKLLKEKQQIRTIKLLAKCQAHKGPLSRDNMELLDKLSYEQVVSEVSYLKATIASDLKLKRRVDDPLNPGKYKMQNLSLQELKTGIRSVIYPTHKVTDGVEDLLGLFVDNRTQSQSEMYVII